MKLNKLLLAAVVVAFGASFASAKVIDTTVATVNGKAVVSSDYDKVKDAVLAEYTKAAPQLMQNKDNVTAIEEEVLNQMISNELLLQASVTEKIKIKDSELAEGINEVKARFSVDAEGKPVKDPKVIEKAFNDELKKEGLTYKQFESKIKEQLAVRKLVDSVVKANIKQPSKEQSKELYDAIRAVLNNDKKTLDATPKSVLEIAAPLAAKLNQITAEQVKISPIFIKIDEKASPSVKKDKEKQAKEIKKDIEKEKITFLEGIQKYSDDKTALANGGEVVLVRGVMTEDFDNKVFSIPVGKIGEPIVTDHGIYIIRVNEKAAKKDFTYEQIEGELNQILAAAQMKQIVTDYLVTLKNKADIKVMKKFEYSAKAAAKPTETPAEKAAAKPVEKPAEAAAAKPAADVKAESKTPAKK